MKKLLCLMLCLLMTVGVFAACAKSDPEKEKVSETESTTTNNPDNNGDVVSDKPLVYGLSMSGITVSETDDRGRLINIWVLEPETMDVPSYQGRKVDPMISFEYGADGKLTKIDGEPVTYDAQGNATAGEGEEVMPVTLEYHSNGSIKKITTTWSDESMSMVIFNSYDEQGRFVQDGMEVTAGGTTTRGISQTCVYEERKITLTMKDGDTVAGTYILELNEKGQPTKATMTEEGDEEGEEGEEMSWTWDGDLLTCYTESFQRGIEGAAPTTCIWKVLHTYDEKGNRIKTEVKENDELREYTTFDYDEEGRLFEVITYDEDDEETEFVCFEYDEDGTLLTVTEETDLETLVYDGQGRLLRYESLSENYLLNILVGYEETIREYVYDVDKSAPYAYYEMETVNEYDDEMELIKAGETKVIFYSEHDDLVDETTGEEIENREYNQDQWGNYMDSENNNEIYYFQKYLNEDGTLYYYTAAGVKTNVE